MGSGPFYNEQLQWLLNVCTLHIHSRTCYYSNEDIHQSKVLDNNYHTIPFFMGQMFSDFMNFGYIYV